MPIGFRPLDIIVIAVVALLIFGPKKLPELSRSIGASIQQFKKGIDDLKNPEPQASVEQPLHRSAADLRLELEALERELANKQAAPMYHDAPHTEKAPNFE
ncbi:Sec-independent protein translocase subunit TatA/TatB [Tengunoibacter tsumagoiensis]|uniref:Sec-independent protein translocase protein TatA n=1 Tax=Tengunoibacter tsumagoiensis TaxID=2014871 RepID=A0A402A4E4_9CHLR|nr:twin-arginine translocase TatA/TatE family subunit [Tengunoibacter tsumagoiensis]GCE13990.1 hypothetical protein KTT_38490 [Tengunoibacter tsumagoiensis]